MGPLIAEFVAGLRSRSLLPVGLGLALFVAFLGVAEWALRRHAYTAIPEERLTVTPDEDDPTHAAYAIARLERRAPTSPTALLLGGSSMREATFETDRLEADLAAASGERWVVESLSSRMQTAGQWLAYVDNLPELPAHQVTVFIGISPRSLARGPAEYREVVQGRRGLVHSPALRQLLATKHVIAPWEGLALQPAALFLHRYWSENRRLLLEGKAPWRLHRKNRNSPPGHTPSQLLREHARRFDGMVTQFHKQIDLTMEVLAETARLAEAKRLRLVLVELPYHPMLAALPEYRRFVESDYAPRIDAFAARHRLEYWKFSASIPFAATDFKDHAHLLDPGRSRFQAAFVERLAAASAAGTYAGKALPTAIRR